MISGIGQKGNKIHNSVSPESELLGGNSFDN